MSRFFPAAAIEGVSSTETDLVAPTLTAFQLASEVERKSRLTVILSLSHGHRPSKSHSLWHKDRPFDCY
jgi:hypothetical protein